MEKGYLPINVGNEEYFYNISELELILKADNELELLEQLCAEEKNLTELQPNLNLCKIDHYDMLRNYMITITEIYVNYFDVIENPIAELVKKMELKIKDIPGLVIDSGTLTGYAVYDLGDDEMLHMFNTKANVMMDIKKFKSQAVNDFKMCSSGMIIEGSQQ